MRFFPAKSVCFDETCQEMHDPKSGRKGGVKVLMHSVHSQSPEHPRSPNLFATPTGIVVAMRDGVTVLFPPHNIRYIRLEDDLELQDLQQEEYEVADELKKLQSDVLAMNRAIVPAKKK